MYFRQYIWYVPLSPCTEPTTGCLCFRLLYGRFSRWKATHHHDIVLASCFSDKIVIFFCIFVHFFFFGASLFYKNLYFWFLYMAWLGVISTLWKVNKLLGIAHFSLHTKMYAISNKIRLYSLFSVLSNFNTRICIYYWIFVSPSLILVNYKSAYIRTLTQCIVWNGNQIFQSLQVR